MLGVRTDDQCKRVPTIQGGAVALSEPSICLPNDALTSDKGKEEIKSNPCSEIVSDFSAVLNSPSCQSEFENIPSNLKRTSERKKSNPLSRVTKAFQRGSNYLLTKNTNPTVNRKKPKNIEMLEDSDTVNLTLEKKRNPNKHRLPLVGEEAIVTEFSIYSESETEDEGYLKLRPPTADYWSNAEMKGVLSLLERDAPLPYSLSKGSNSSFPSPSMNSNCSFEGSEIFLQNDAHFAEEDICSLHNQCNGKVKLNYICKSQQCPYIPAFEDLFELLAQHIEKIEARPVCEYVEEFRDSVDRGKFSSSKAEVMSTEAESKNKKGHPEAIENIENDGPDEGKEARDTTGDSKNEYWQFVESELPDCENEITSTLVDSEEATCLKDVSLMDSVDAANKAGMSTDIKYQTVGNTASAEEEIEGASGTSCAKGIRRGSILEKKDINIIDKNNCEESVTQMQHVKSEDYPEGRCSGDERIGLKSVDAKQNDEDESSEDICHIGYATETTLHDYNDKDGDNGACDIIQSDIPKELMPNDDGSSTEGKQVTLDCRNHSNIKKPVSCDFEDSQGNDNSSRYRFEKTELYNEAVGEKYVRRNQEVGECLADAFKYEGEITCSAPVFQSDNIESDIDTQDGGGSHRDMQKRRSRWTRGTSTTSDKREITDPEKELRLGLSDFPEWMMQCDIETEEKRVPAFTQVRLRKTGLLPSKSVSDLSAQIQHLHERGLKRNRAGNKAGSNEMLRSNSSSLVSVSCTERLESVNEEEKETRCSVGQLREKFEKNRGDWFASQLKRYLTNADDEVDEKH